jgi:integrase
MHTHARHVPNPIGAPSKKIVFHKNEFQTRFTKRDATHACDGRRGMARRAGGGGGGGVRVGFFSSHSLRSTRRAHLINHFNSLPTNNVGLNFSPQPTLMAATEMGLENSRNEG